MGQKLEARVGKKYAIYLPRAVVRAAGIKEGERVSFKVAEGKIAMEIIQNPLDLAIHGRKFASLSAKEAEETSVTEQAKYTESAA